jgi:hypothetical protein
VRKGSVGNKGKLKAGILMLAMATMITSAGHAQEISQENRSIDQAATYQIARLTGQDSINRTGERWNIYGTDLGHMFRHECKLYMTFGDTFGAPGKPPQFGGDWRSNTMAWSKDQDPRDGITFGGMITDRPGHAKELITDAQVPGEEVSVIPTYGTSTGKNMILHYMAVREWIPPGAWTLNRSGLAYSQDDGRTWKVSDVVWPGGSNFGQVAFVKREGYLYLFGIPGGRWGGAKLARVEIRDVLNRRSYEYWDGRRWQNDQGNAATVIQAPVGELSVRWNSYYDRWLMMYLDVERGAVVLRTAGRLTGPWSEEQVVVTAEKVPRLYAPYMPPRWNDGPDIYFTLSRFDEYDVFWWRTSLGGGTTQAGSVSGATASCGAPTITNNSPTGSITDRTPTIAATVADKETDLAASNIRLFVDGVRKDAFNYARATNRLTYSRQRFALGKHTVKVVATDAQGKVGTKTWTFTQV